MKRVVILVILYGYPTLMYNKKKRKHLLHAARDILSYKGST